MSEVIPVVLFAYDRPDHLRRTLACLCENQVPLIYAYSDGAATPDKNCLVKEVRGILKSIDWCRVIICERDRNLGLGKSILAGVTEVLEKHEMCLVFEDDLICVPGTYKYLCAALYHYRDFPRVMSVTGWNHPLVTPGDVVDQPYFDGRAECWVWGTWARAWRGMEEDAKSLMLACEAQGIDRNKYGADLPVMAEDELKRNIWAVRFLFHHIVSGGLCLRPPRSMVQHIGFDAQATNASSAGKWGGLPLKSCPPLPRQWPEPVESVQCPDLWQRACGKRPPKSNRFLPVSRHALSKVKRISRKIIKKLAPAFLIRFYHAWINVAQKTTPAGSIIYLEGDYASWGEAIAASAGYDSDIILEKTRDSLLEVKNGTAVYERDSVIFNEVQYSWPILAGLMWAAARNGGNLNVLDYGGSLGSTYFQNRAFFSGLGQVRWNIIEQAKQVEVGKQCFEGEQLRFFSSIEQCLAETQPHVILLSSVLQYLPDPYFLLNQLKSLPCDLLLIDRTPFWFGPTDRLCVQHVPASIYPASYPIWVFSKNKFRKMLEEDFEVVAEFDSLDHLQNEIDASWSGMTLTGKVKG